MKLNKNGSFGARVFQETRVAFVQKAKFIIVSRTDRRTNEHTDVPTCVRTDGHADKHGRADR